MLTQTPSSAKAWNVQHTLSNATGYEPSSEIAQPFTAWIDKLWEQSGDGRKIASKLQLQLALLAVLWQHSFRFLENSNGLSATLADCLAQGSGLESFDEACDHALQAYERTELPDSQLPLAAAEQEALACIQKARLVLEEQGLIDLGNALSYLANHKEEVFLKPLAVKFVDAVPLSTIQLAFFERCADVCELEEESNETVTLQTPEEVEVRIAHALGALAQPQLILNTIHDMLIDYPGSHVVVTCKEPGSLFNRIGPALSQAGISCAAQISVSFEQTDFGRVYSLVKMLDADADADVISLDMTPFSDILLSPLCGLKKKDAWLFNKTVRGNRLTTREEARALLIGKSELLDSMLAGDYSSPVFETCFHQLLQQGVASAYVREQQSAFYALRDVLASLEQFGVTGKDLQDILLRQISFPASCMFAPENDTENGGEAEEPGEVKDNQAGLLPQVRIMSQQAARALGPKSVDLLIVCDLTTASYPLSDKHSAVQTILQALGIQEQMAILARERTGFNKLLQVASRRLVLERCLNDEEADPLYPSAMLEEFMAAHAQVSEEMPDVDVLGEQNFAGDACPVYPGCEVPTEELLTSSRESVSTQRHLVAPHSSHQAFPELPRLSPSQIELYLDCPYKWFVMNRIGVDTLDEELGPAQKGSFLHTVFQRFYSSFGQKVTPANLEEARHLMFGPDGSGGIFAQVRDEQYAMDEQGIPLRNRYVPLQDTIEAYQFDTLKERVDDWLIFETTFLPAYRPIMLEYRFQGITFAGCEITGVIDRIDQNDEGHLVIIDYKGALKNEHAALQDGQFLDNGKIQALLYALLVDEIDDIPASKEDVVGSLYVSYNRKNPVKGAYRARYLGRSDIPSVSSGENCSLLDDTALSFENLLGCTADRIAQAVEGIQRGDIAPSPKSSGACRYCPVLTCEMRGK